MIFSRLFSLILRLAQFIFAVIVLGLTAYFLFRVDRHGGSGSNGGNSRGDLLARLIFSVIWSSLSVLFAIIWAIPTTSSMTGFVSDLGKSKSENRMARLVGFSTSIIANASCL